MQIENSLQLETDLFKQILRLGFDKTTGKNKSDTKEILFDWILESNQKVPPSLLRFAYLPSCSRIIWDTLNEWQLPNILWNKKERVYSRSQEICNFKITLCWVIKIEEQMRSETEISRLGKRGIYSRSGHIRCTDYRQWLQPSSGVHMVNRHRARSAWHSKGNDTTWE